MILLFAREWRLAWRNRADSVNPLLFNFTVVALFPLGVSSDPELLARIGPGVLWVSALLAVLLSLDGLFRADHDEGTLEQVAVGHYPLAAYALAKLLVHWVFTGCVLTILSPLLGLMLGLSGRLILWNLPVLGAGTLAFSALGVMVAALLTGLQRSGVLLALLVLPLYVPVLILGTGSLATIAAGYGPNAPLAWLLAYTLAVMALAPWVTAGALKLTVNE